jgi:hypothetical protein
MPRLRRLTITAIVPFAWRCVCLFGFKGHQAMKAFFLVLSLVSTSIPAMPLAQAQPVTGNSGSRGATTAIDDLWSRASATEGPSLRSG